MDEAIAFGDVLFIAVPYGALPQIGQDYGAKELTNKVMLDACNAVAARDGAPIADEVEKDGVGVVSQKYLAGARIVAPSTPSTTISLPARPIVPIVEAILIAGDDAEAVRTAEGLIRDAGFDTVVVGKLADARRFQRGGPGYGQEATAAELRQKLSITP